MKFTKENVMRVVDEWIGSVGEDMSTLNKRISELDDTPEKVVIPQFVADRIEEYEEEDKCDRLESFMADYQDDLHSNEVDEYYGEDKMKIINAILNGYEVEKEPLYEVLIPFERYILSSGKLETCYNKLAFDNTSGESKLAPKYYQFYDNFESRLTEFEIKSIDERFWAFAVKVEESE